MSEAGVDGLLKLAAGALQGDLYTGSWNSQGSVNCRETSGIFWKLLRKLPGGSGLRGVMMVSYLDSSQGMIFLDPSQGPITYRWVMQVRVFDDKT